MTAARPLHAYAALGLALVGWLAWRLPAVQADIATVRSSLDAPSVAPPGVVAVNRSATYLVETADDAELAAIVLRLPTVAPAPATPEAPRLSIDPSIYEPQVMLTLWAPEPPAAVAVPVATSTPLPMPVAAGASAAEQGYRLLAAGDRKRAAAAFRQAIAQSVGDPRVPQWRAQLGYLEQRWSGSAYTLVRNSGRTLLTAAIPALTAAQSGAQVAYKLNPLSPQPFAAQARIVTANDGVALNDVGAQAAVALTWQPIPAAQVAVERLVRAGPKSRNAWTVRVAGGGESLRPPGRRAWNAWSAYAETGIIGTKRQDLYAASALRVGRAIGLNEKVALTLGAGVWGSVQHYNVTAHWIEVGPSAQFRVESKPPVNVALDYRVRINGNADPGTGPALTVSTGF